MGHNDFRRYTALSSRLKTIVELWAFLKARKRWWLAPIVLVLASMAAFILLTEGSVAAPFIYTLF